MYFLVKYLNLRYLNIQNLLNITSSIPLYFYSFFLKLLIELRFIDRTTFEQSKKLLSASVSKNGKVTDWSYQLFNKWVDQTDRSKKEKEQLYALQNICK